MKKLLLLCAAQLLVVGVMAQPEIISYGSIWKYLDNGSNQGTGWTALDFDDELWKSGPAELGYGDDDEATVISYGGKAKKKYITSYFRKEVTIVDHFQYSSLELAIKRDDGAVVYLNGIEVFRTNMPSGKITYDTKASRKISNADSYDKAQIPPGNLIRGKNVIAVEIHQFRNGDSDVSFDLRLAGLTGKKNTSPVANAGPDQTIKLPLNSVKLNGSSSSDADGTITKFLWTKIAGPSTYSLMNPEKKNVIVKDLIEGSYTFRLTVTDNAGDSDNDEVVITVNAANLPPVSDAGPDQTIFLPGNAVILDGTKSKDPDGKIISFQWEQVLGPATEFLINSNKTKCSAIGLLAGIYKYRLTVTDNAGKTASDEVVVTVKPRDSLTSGNFISFGDSWKYLDDGSDAGTEWRQPGFDDDSWASGNGELGYGDGDESTIVSYGPDQHDKYITTYFRKVINISNTANYRDFTMAVKRDDGVVVYLNGNEIFRSNMREGPVNYQTLASAGAFRDGYDIQSFTIPPGTFVDGDNTIAVEIHQLKVSNSDISFDLALAGNETGENLPPVANAGPDQTVTLPTNSVTLDGSGSSDADGTITTWLWTKVSGPSTFTITTPGNTSTTVTGLVQGTYTFRLTVTDDDGATNADDVVITVNPANVPPVAKAGPDQTITLPTNSVTLNGSGSSDADGTITTWLWTKVSGPSTYTITSPNSAVTTVTGLVAGSYTFRLTVTDNDGATNSNDVVITVNPANLPPVAKAGPDQTITLPTNSVTLDGSGSSDADGTITAWLWTKVSGPSTYTITTPGNTSTTVTGLMAGTYTFRLTVTDDDGATNADDVVITVNPANVPPVAKSGPDQTITLPTNSVTLNGSGSSDADGTITTWLWTKVSGPSSFTITTPGNTSTTVTGLVQGTYTFRLTVTDDDGATNADDVVITVNPANLPPVANAGLNQTITLPANSVTLDGSGSSDADGTITAWLWTKVSGPSTFTITTPGNTSTTVTGLVQGTYTFRLTVTDDDGATNADDVVITVNPANVPPVAKSGPDQTITLPTNSVTLNGSGSSDADGTITTWLWTKVSGPSTYTITTPANSSTTVTGLVQGTYTFRLTVTDDDGATNADDVVITVNPANLPPVAKAGPDQTVTLPTNSVTLNGSGSSDADGTITTWLWTKVSGPSSFTITTPGNTSTTVTGLVQGTYTFRLTVTDDDGATNTDDVVITVNPANVPPVAKSGPDQTITLPTNSVTLNGSGSSDADGTITTWLWTKVSGPSSFTITTPGNTSTTVTGLVQGTYTFRLTVTDDDGATNTDDVVITVNAETGSPITLTRGPYLQMASTNAVTLRWRTDVASDSKISVGTQNGVYTSSATNATVTTEHEVRINGLSSGKKYYYSFGSSAQTLQAGSDNFFNTAPATSSTGKIRVAAFGDCGRNQSGFQTGTLNSYRNYVGSSPAEIMLLLGDNAYDDGTDAEYQSNFFDVYSSNIFKNHVIFPAPGNHDYHTTTKAERTAPYYNVFTMPTAAECGGVASGTKAFYSFNWGNIHFLSLDSYGEEAGSTRLYDTLGPQVTWIKQDLAANSSKWTIAFWHHPPHTKGSHNSDSESELVKIRQNFIRILERYGVDMVLCGHSHDYERSYLLKGYYGTEASFDLATNSASSSSAFYDGSANSCPYNLPSGKINHGTVYVVAGSAGADGSVQSGYPHDAMPFSVDDGGMLYFEVENNRLDAKFIRRDGTIADKFTIMKDAGKTTAVSIATGQSVTLTASWIGNYSWSNGAKTQSITVSPSSNATYTCSDGSSCITDQFNVSVGSPANSITLATDKFDYKLTAYPTPVVKGEWLTIKTNVAVSLDVNVINDKGQKVKHFKLLGSTRMNTSDMRNGVYYLRSEKDGKKIVKKIMIIH